MRKTDKEMAVAALESGTVIDHIPSEALFKCVKILRLADMPHKLTIGNNLDSESVLNRIALIAPTAVVNIIRDYQVAEKHPVTLPKQLRGIVRCGNPKCITNNEPMATIFESDANDSSLIRCHYCNHTIQPDKAEIL